MKIRIGIWSLTEQYAVFADEQTKEFNINGRDKIAGVEGFVRETIQIVSGWPDLLEDRKLCDGVVYKIVYDDGETVRKLSAHHKVPVNFAALMNLIKRYEPNNKKFLMAEERRNAALAGHNGWDF